MINAETLKREKMLFAYTTALEQGDFARLETILETAASDTILERQILEINTVLSQPRDTTAAQPAPESLLVHLWQRIKTTTAGLLSIKIRNWPVLRSIALGAGAFIIVVFGVLALLGPAVGKIFTNVVVDFPTSSQRLPPVATRTVAENSPTDSFRGYGYPPPVTVPQLTLQTAQPGAQPAERLIVHDGSLTVVANDTRQARQAVMDMVSEYAAEGAFVVSSNETYPSSGQMPMISMVLRVPVIHYDESMTRLAGLGIQVLNRTETAQDVTQDYVDTTARIQALETSRARLLEIIKEAKNTDDLLRAEQELSSREAELESAKARQLNLSKTAALSSITVELRPTVTSQPVADSGWNPAATLHNAVSALLTTLRGIADGAIFFAVTTVPWLVVIALLIYGAVRFFRRKLK